jgi:adenylate kinase family enzyme
MENSLSKRIYIIGSVASGKTSMAQRLSKQLSIPWYELDNVYHLRLPYVGAKLPLDDRISIFNTIVASDKWIIEGVRRECFDVGFEKADIIILLDTPQYIRCYRILKRWILQRLGLVKSNYAPTIKMLLKMFEWSMRFEKSKDEIHKTLEPYKDKLIFMNNNKTTVSFSEHQGRQH